MTFLCSLYSLEEGLPPSLAASWQSPWGSGFGSKNYLGSERWGHMGLLPVALSATWMWSMFGDPDLPWPNSEWYLSQKQPDS